jgi:hypothetical protein
LPANSTAWRPCAAASAPATRTAPSARKPAPATNPFILVNASGTDLQPTRRFDVDGVRVSFGYRF